MGSSIGPRTTRHHPVEASGPGRAETNAGLTVVAVLATAGTGGAATGTSADGALEGAGAAASHPSSTALACSLRRQATRTIADVASATTWRRVRLAMTRGDYCMTQVELEPLT